MPALPTDRQTKGHARSATAYTGGVDRGVDGGSRSDLGICPQAWRLRCALCQRHGDADDSSNQWTIKAFDVPVDALRLLRSAIGRGVAEFVLRLTDHTGREHESRGRIRRTSPLDVGFQLLGDDLTFVYVGHID